MSYGSDGEHTSGMARPSVPYRIARSQYSGQQSSVAVRSGVKGSVNTGPKTGEFGLKTPDRSLRGPVTRRRLQSWSSGTSSNSSSPIFCY